MVRRTDVSIDNSQQYPLTTISNDDDNSCCCQVYVHFYLTIGFSLSPSEHLFTLCHSTVLIKTICWQIREDITNKWSIYYTSMNNCSGCLSSENRQATHFVKFANLSWKSFTQIPVLSICLNGKRYLLKLVGINLKSTTHVCKHCMFEFQSWV